MAKTAAKASKKPAIEKTCDCQETEMGEDASFDETRNKLSRAGARALHSLPTAMECKRVQDPAIRDYLEAVRYLAVEASQAANFDDDELISLVATIDIIDLTSEAIFVTYADDQPGAGGDGLSCTGRCKKEKDDCMKKCAGISFPCRCCADCRMHNIACLAACIFGSHSNTLIM